MVPDIVFDPSYPMIPAAARLLPDELIQTLSNRNEP
jgi:hypothetical protein